MDPSTDDTEHLRLAFKFTFARPLRPLSDAEGIINGIVDDSGVDKGGRFVSPDRQTMYVLFSPAEPAEIAGTVYHDSVEDALEYIVDRVEDSGWLDVDDIDITTLTAVEREELFRTAALAEKHAEDAVAAEDTLR